MTSGSSYALVLPTPLPGELRLGVVLREEHLASLDFLPAATALQPPDSAQLVTIEQQLVHYFLHPAAPHALSLHPQGTPFQQRVWQALQRIPCGVTQSYGALALQLKSSPRAVAAACRANPIPLLIPCHRVVASNGLGGYMGATVGEALELKMWLLRHEGAL